MKELLSKVGWFLFKHIHYVALIVAIVVALVLTYWPRPPKKIKAYVNPYLQEYGLQDIRKDKHGVTVLWSTGFCDIDDPNMEKKMDLMVAAGCIGFRSFSYVARTYTESPWLKVNSNNQLDNGTGQWDLTKYNQRWWDHFDKMLYEAAVKRGLYVIVSVMEECQIRHKSDVGEVALQRNINGIDFTSNPIAKFNSFSDPKWNNVRDSFIERLYAHCKPYLYTGKIMFEPVNEGGYSKSLQKYIYDYYRNRLGYTGIWIVSSFGLPVSPSVALNKYKIIESMHNTGNGAKGVFPSADGDYITYATQISRMVKAFKKGIWFFEAWDSPGCAGYVRPDKQTSRWNRRRKMFNLNFFKDIRFKVAEPIYHGVF